MDTDSLKSRSKRLFRYENRWRFDPRVKKVIQDVWNYDCVNLPAADFDRVIEKM